MLDHKTVEVEDQLMKMQDREYANIIQKEVDSLIVAAKMLNYEVTTQYQRHSPTLTGIFVYLKKQDEETKYNYKLDFLMNGDLYLKQIRLNFQGLGEVTVGNAKNGFTDPIKRLQEML